jgi:hypothetical protein
MVCRLLIAGVLLVLALVPVARADDVVLSDERLLSRWAHPAQAAVVRAEPRDDSRPVGRLRFFTEDDLPEVYLLLHRRRDADGDAWVHLRLPQRPNGVTGWVRRDALGAYRITRQQLVINRQTFWARLYENGKVVWRARVGVGAVGTKTPAGRFWIRGKLRFSNLPLYGTRALGTAAYAPTLSDWPGGGVVGIHGTGQPWLIPGRPSHGCVRVRNRDVERLYRLVDLGAPLLIR